MSGNLPHQDWRREELIDGKIVAMAPTSVGHTYVADGILNIFRNYLKGKNCVPFGDGILVHLTDKDKFTPMKKLKKLTVLGIAAALMVVTCAAAVVTGIDQRILGYFHIAQEQEPLMAPSAIRVEKSHTYDNGWTVEVQQAMTDRYSMAVLFDVTAPEGMSLNWEGSGLSIEPHPDRKFSGMGWRVDHMADEDPEDNRTSYLLFLHYDNHDGYDIIGSVWDLTPKYFWYVEQDGTSREVALGSWTCTVQLSDQDPGLLYDMGQTIFLKGCETDLDQVYLSPISFAFRLRHIPGALWEIGSGLGREDLEDYILLHTASGEAIEMETLVMGGLTNPESNNPDDPDASYGLYMFRPERVIDPAEIVSVTICDQTFDLK